MTCKSLHRLVVCKRERYLDIYDVESFLGALEELYGSFSDIGAHQDLQKPNVVMPELLKELCIYDEMFCLDLLNIPISFGLVVNFDWSIDQPLMELDLICCTHTKK